MTHVASYQLRLYGDLKISSSEYSISSSAIYMLQDCPYWETLASLLAVTLDRMMQRALCFFSNFVTACDNSVCSNGNPLGMHLIIKAQIIRHKSN